ncbi:hypothetical protein C806_00065 [Lachnospiraceae bacterium 3-1]|nr:hypothetical protein C806_00065 [Lachnospiraceae bacterium 3-1]
MYFLFREKKWKPTDYKDMGTGEKRIVHAFMLEELEDRERMKEEIENGQV